MGRGITRDGRTAGIDQLGGSFAMVGGRRGRPVTAPTIPRGVGRLGPGKIDRRPDRRRGEGRLDRRGVAGGAEAAAVFRRLGPFAAPAAGVEFRGQEVAQQGGSVGIVAAEVVLDPRPRSPRLGRLESFTDPVEPVEHDCRQVRAIRPHFVVHGSWCPCRARSD